MTYNSENSENYFEGPGSYIGVLNAPKLLKNLHREGPIGLNVRILEKCPFSEYSMSELGG